MGEKIAERQIPKIFLLNGSHDRETSASKSTAGPMTACDVVLALCDALNRRHAKVGAACKLQAAGPLLPHPVHLFICPCLQDMVLSAWSTCRLANRWTIRRMLTSLLYWFRKGAQLPSIQHPWKQSASGASLNSAAIATQRP